MPAAAHQRRPLHDSRQRSTLGKSAEGYDAIVKPTVIDQQMARITHAQIRMIAGAGHACFWEAAALYNRCLQEFIESL